MRLVYSKDAVEDLARLRNFIHIHDPEAAARISEELLSRIRELCTYPSMGRPVQLAPDSNTVRDLVFGNYIIRYVPRDEVVIVLRVWHQRESFRS
jgi:plasmid stabilization system protein ParE